MRQTRRTKAAFRKYIRRHLIGDKHCFCTGCCKLFEYTDILRNHRRSFRCGGMFLTEQADDILIHGYIRRPRLIDPRGTGIIPRKEHETKHHGRVPGTIRTSRLPGNGGYRNRPLGQKTGKKHVTEAAASSRQAQQLDQIQQHCLSYSPRD